MTNTEAIITWNGTTLVKTSVETSVGNVPIIKFIPDTPANANPIFAIHYQEGSKEIWLDEESCSPILEFAIENNVPFFAADLYGHGNWKSSDSSFNPEYLNDEQWELFISKSVTGFKEVVDDFIKNDSINFIAYSTGCLIAVKLMAEGINTSSLIMASPVPAKSYDDEYSLHNNLETLKDKKVLVLTGINDNEVETGEVDWYFDQIKSSLKELVTYNSGHELPKEWTEKSVTFLKDS